MLLCSNNENASKLCYNLKIRKKDCAVITEVLAGYSYLKEATAKIIKKNSVLYDILAGRPGELLLVLSAAGKNHYENVTRFLAEISGIKTEITGNDLQALKIVPSKNYRFILDKILKLKLDKKITTKQEEIEAASAMIKLLR